MSVSSRQTARVCGPASASPRPCAPSRSALTRSRHSNGASGTASTTSPARTQPSSAYHGGPPPPVTGTATADSVAHASSFLSCGEQASLSEGAADGSVCGFRDGRAGSGTELPGWSVIVYAGVDPRVGVGSKRVQPTPSKYTSGHACASRSPTETEPSACGEPGAKPTATRAGMPRERAIAAMAKEKWTQKPSFSFRNRAIASEPLPMSTWVSYSKPPLTAKYSWSLTACS